MQIIITLKPDKQINLPIAYRHAVQSAIYNALKTHPEYSAVLHNEGAFAKNNTTFKLFTFSQFEGSYTVINKRIIFENQIVFEIRCFDSFLCQLLLDGFRCGNKVQLLNNELTVESCLLKNEIIYDNRITVRMISPITVLSNKADKHTQYHTPEEKIFYDKIIANAKRKWCVLSNEEEFNLTISPADNHFNKLVTLFKGTYVNAWYGTFIIEGNPKVIDFIYNVGIGNKTSQGFGMFEII